MSILLVKNPLGPLHEKIDASVTVTSMKPFGAPQVVDEEFTTVIDGATIPLGRSAANPCAWPAAMSNAPAVGLGTFV